MGPYNQMCKRVQMHRHTRLYMSSQGKTSDESPAMSDYTSEACVPH